MSKRILRAAVFALVAALAGGAIAAPGQLVLVIAGEAYDGPPKFEVSFNGAVLGQGTVETAIDTANGGRFADAAEQTTHQQTFEFAIPEEAFSPGGEVRVRFLNEAFGGEGSNRDRNLFIQSLTVNGLQVPAPKLATVSSAGIEPNTILGEYLVLYDGTADAVSPAPAGGWPGADTASADAVPAPAPVEVAVTTAAEAPQEQAAAPAEVPAIPTVRTMTAPRVLPTTPEAPAAVATPPAEPVPAEEPMVTAAIAPAGGPQPQSPCELDQLYNVVGFNENSNDLTARLRDRLDDILMDIGPNECVVQVVGYSSTHGNHATNALFAVERAQNVLAYLRANGLKAAKATATGAGATEQFGPEPSKNRRVVITVGP